MKYSIEDQTEMESLEETFNLTDGLRELTFPEHLTEQGVHLDAKKFSQLFTKRVTDKSAETF